MKRWTHDRSPTNTQYHPKKEKVALAIKEPKDNTVCLFSLPLLPSPRQQSIYHKIPHPPQPSSNHFNQRNDARLKTPKGSMQRRAIEDWREREREENMNWLGYGERKGCWSHVMGWWCISSGSQWCRWWWVDGKCDDERYEERVCRMVRWGRGKLVLGSKGEKGHQNKKHRTRKQRREAIRTWRIKPKKIKFQKRALLNARDFKLWDEKREKKQKIRKWLG